MLYRLRNVQDARMFEEGPEEVIDNPRSGLPTISHTDVNVFCVCHLLDSDFQMTVGMMAQIVTLHTIRTNDLNILIVCAKLVPKVLTDEKKAN